MKKKFYLMRHGESEANVRQILCSGRYDWPLTELGQKQAADAEKIVYDLDIEKIYTSPNKRAYQTAEIVNKRKKVALHIWQDLKTWDVGDWDGMLYDLWRKNLAAGLEPENGESTKDLCTRIHNAVQSILNIETAPFLITAHGEHFYALARELSIETQIRISNAEIIEFSHEDGKWDVVKL